MNNTARNFALQLGSLVSLYISVTSLSVLLFNVITVMFPDDVDYYFTYESAADAIRFSVAILIVFFPTYLVLTRITNQVRRQQDQAYLSITKWLIYLSLLVGGGILLGDLVAVIYAFLEGEITVRFVLKVVTLLVVVGAAFLYYLKDAQGYWQTHEKKSLYYGVGASLIVVISLILGFMNSETPTEVRETRIDDNQISDLQNIQWRTEEYYRINDQLPKNFEQAFGGLEVPSAPSERSDYRYEVVDSTHYKLCAKFAFDSAGSEYTYPRAVPTKEADWSHGEGEWCFERVVEVPEID